MKNIIYTIIILSVLSGCSAGETDKTSPVHESEELNLKKDKNSDTVIVSDTVKQ